ncbi:hypothetical protein [Parvibaculum sp.]|uniref:hypothetical protein n=1 Tax=Parvibaculum sp. TaxID=2024848 RepID=UPI003919AA83
MAGKFWPVLFGAAAIYNFMAGLPPVLIPAMSAANLGLPPYAPEHVIIAQISGLLICTFGIGYTMVAFGSPGSRQIVTLGLIGKLSLCVLLAVHLMQGPVPRPMLIATAGDLLFSIAFIVWLVRNRPVPALSPA